MIESLKNLKVISSYMELSSRGISQKTWDKMDSAERKAYLKENPTSKYGKKLSKRQRQEKANARYNINLKKAIARADKLGIHDEFMDCAYNDPYILHNWKLNDYSKDYIINECNSRNFLNIKNEVKKAIVDEIKKRKLELDIESRRGVFFYDKDKNERNFRIYDNGKWKGFSLDKDASENLFCYLQEKDTEYKSPKITKETSDSEIKEIVKDFFDKVL